MSIDIQRLRECASQLRNLMPQRILDPDIHAVQDLVAFVDQLFATPTLDGAIAALDAERPKPEAKPDDETAETKPAKAKATSDVGSRDHR